MAILISGGAGFIGSHLINNFVFASSVYGTNEKMPFNEENRVDNPASVSGVTEKAGELLCSVYHYFYVLNINCLKNLHCIGHYRGHDLCAG